MTTCTQKSKAQYCLKLPLKTKYSDVNLTLKNLYVENYNTLMNKIKGGLNGRHTLFMDWKMRSSKDVNSPQIDTQV